MQRFGLTSIIIIAVIVELFNSLILCRRTNVQESDEKILEQKDLWKIFEAISHAKENIPSNRKSRRANDQIKYFYDAFANSADFAKLKNWLRQETVGGIEEEPTVDEKDEFAGLVEDELLNALSKKSSALLDRPYVQKKGRNDFLVIRSDLKDPFVTVVPNDIYYNVEKKCINWLDDCNQRGIRDRLLQKVNSPYK